MPSSLAAGPFFRFVNVVRKLNIKPGAILHFDPQAAPASGVKGDMYVGTDGKLYIHNGTAFVVVGTQA